MCLLRLKWRRCILLTFINCIAVDCFSQLPTENISLAAGISAYNIQDLNFGTFAHNNMGGTISISNTGSRTVTGNIVAINSGMQQYQAIFELEAPARTIVSILNGPDITLTGSNGGTMQLQIGNSDPKSPFIITAVSPSKTQINIGGTLTVGNSATSPPGNYSGSFYIIFNQE